ncbi:hypothetical protein BDP27DRAFT_1430736 [Rhodocollybia butyracea]|uniref:Uncharacterized protein n=1 Tax=Rhodocollybia butyracea TaxID=206335 RepID=A0A9P5P7W1_9AGAR|nr:hypothetical protein BDP27DRAFT_1430721 [Rhodocollybia butyracea]KAF9059902.1 hypothetical protein BDP27DRAFT_1430736 [Rhodocollybia butyracea]
MSLLPLLKNPQRPPPLTAEAYRLTLVQAPTTRKRSRRNHNHNELVILPNGRTLTQNPALPRLPGQIGLRGERPVNLEESAAPAPLVAEQEYFGGTIGGERPTKRHETSGATQAIINNVSQPIRTFKIQRPCAALCQ